MLKPSGMNWSKKTVATIMNQLKLIRKENGLITPELVVEAARSPDSPLHGYFEWDDSAAAEKWRLHQARNLIGKLYINIGTEELPRNVRVLVNVNKDSQSQYVPITEIKRSNKLSQDVIARMLRDMETFQKRYEAYESFIDLSPVDNIIKELTILLEDKKVGTAG